MYSNNQPRESSYDFNIYNVLDRDLNTETYECNGIHIVTIHEEFNSVSDLAIIEKFVKTIAGSAEQKPSGDQPYQKKKKMTRFFNQMTRCLQAHTKNHIYSPHITVFYESCIELNIQPGLNTFGTQYERSEEHGGMTYEALFNSLISKIRSKLNGSKFKRSIRAFLRTALRRKSAVLQWEKSLFEWRSRQLILDLVLSYKEEFRHSIDLPAIQSDLARLIHNKKHNNLLKGIDAYVWKIEEGDKTGLHVHLLIAYSTTSNKDIYITEEIGKYWEAMITDGKGKYNNRNRYTYQPPLRSKEVPSGLGQIDHYDEKKRHELRKILIYFAKSDQHLKQRNALKTRTFQMSQIPQKCNAGRPRKFNENATSL